MEKVRKCGQEKSAAVEYWKLGRAEAGASLDKGVAFGKLLQVSRGLEPALD